MQQLQPPIHPRSAIRPHSDIGGRGGSAVHTLGGSGIQLNVMRMNLALLTLFKAGFAPPPSRFLPRGKNRCVAHPLGLLKSEHKLNEWLTITVRWLADCLGGIRLLALSGHACFGHHAD